MEDERRQRVQDVRHRTMGLDVDALAAQVKEKKEREQAEADRDKFYDTQRLQVDQQLEYLEQQKQDLMRQRATDLQNFRSSYQHQGTRREFDLNNPQERKLERPARVSDADENLSVSGMQKFHGEDLGHAARVAAQKQQMRDWNMQQAAEKKAREHAEKQADQIWAARQFEVDSMKGQLERAQRDQRNAQQIALAEYNLALAQSKRDKQRSAQVGDVQDSIEEIQNNLSSDILNENPAQAQSYFQQHRVRRDHYKGMSDAERRHYLEEIGRQQQELQQKKVQEKESDQQWEGFSAQVRHMGELHEQQIEQKRQQLRKELASTHQQQAAEQKAKLEYLNKQVYQNELEPSYFASFGTSSR